LPATISTLLACGRSALVAFAVVAVGPGIGTNDPSSMTRLPLRLAGSGA
jgi:hypothetical protein